ncbi:MAG: hypothetical protein ACO305_02360 [Rubrivivax sp.]|jgi:hypothetical protein
MMLLLRLIVGGLLLWSAGYFVLYMLTRNPVWRHRGLRVLRWTVLGVLGFFLVLIMERVVRSL